MNPTTRPANACRTLATALLGALAASAALAQSYPVYTVTALPISGFTALNDRGQILGRAFLPCSGICALVDSAALYDTASGTLTGLSGGFGAGVQFGAINAHGQLAGTQTSRDAAGALVRSVVVRQPDGSLTPVAAPTLPATLGSPLQVRGFNASGQVALQYTEGLDLLAPNCGTYLGWTGTTAGTWQAQGPADARVSLVGINASGRAVGSAVAAAACGGAGAGYRAIATQANGTLVNLHGSLPGSFSRATAVNDLGYAVGDYDSGARTQPDAVNPQGLPISRAVVWNTASLAWFDLGPAGALSRLNAVNNRGEVVGRSTGPVIAGQPYAPTTSVAVLGNLATPWPLVDLNALLAGNSAGWVLREALAINGAGQIVASGHSAAGSGYALLTPVSAPADPYAVLPTAPASLAASQVTATSARLSWTNTARNATRLVVERCKGKTCTGFSTIATLAGDTSAYANAGLASRTTYRWRVRAGNVQGLSAPSQVVMATTTR